MVCNTEIGNSTAQRLAVSVFGGFAGLAAEMDCDDLRVAAPQLALALTV